MTNQKERTTPSTAPTIAWRRVAIRAIVVGVCLTAVIGLAAVQHLVVLGLEPQLHLFVIPGFVGAGFGVLILWVSENLAKSRRLHTEVLQRETAVRQLNEQLESVVAERTARMVEQDRELQNTRRAESIGRLSAGVAHDLNSLLTSMGGYAWLVLQEGALPGEDNMHRIIDAVQRAQTLTQQLLSTGGTRFVRPKVLDVTEQIREIVRHYQGHPDVTGSLTFTHPERPAWVYIDPTAMQQVIQNLVSNALHVIEPTGAVNVDVSVRGDKVHIVVQDDGPGISQDVLPRIFEPFFTTKGERGTGLGLAVARGLIEQSEGELSVISAAGAGATFSITLALQGSPTQQPSSAAPTEIRPVRSILLVEDDPIIRQLTARLLTRDGLDVVAAGSVQEAMDHCVDGSQFDVVLSDVQLPDGRGTLLVQELLEQGLAHRAVIVSGQMTTQAIDDMQQLPLVPVLSKPYSPQVLLRAVRGQATALVG